MDKRENKFRLILVELAHHLPFSVSGVVAAIISLALLTFLSRMIVPEQELASASADLFHIFHPFHILFSALTTTAIFWKHDNKNMFKAVVIGLVGSLSICGLSDIMIPYIGGLATKHPMHFHVCLIENPGLILPFAVTGVIGGFLVPATFERSTQYSHGVHVFLSSAASLLYLMSFGFVDWMHSITSVFFITITAVMVPCCLSDIVFPMVCTHRYCRHPLGEGAHAHK